MPTTDPSKRRQHARDHYQRHREERLAYAARYRAAHRAELVQKNREYRASKRAETQRPITEGKTDD